MTTKPASKLQDGDRILIDSAPATVIDSSGYGQWRVIRADLDNGRKVEITVAAGVRFDMANTTEED